MKKQLFVAAFCGVLLFMVGLLWWRVLELEKIVDSLRQQRASNSTVVWQNEQHLKKDTEKKNVFKLIDSPPVDPDKSNIGVPWSVERAMMGGAERHDELKPTEQWQTIEPVTPDAKFVPDRPESN
jgi:hypothetical protein